jgi:hypothetical protein
MPGRSIFIDLLIVPLLATLVPLLEPPFTLPSGILKGYIKVKRGEMNKERSKLVGENLLFRDDEDKSKRICGNEKERNIIVCEWCGV